MILELTVERSNREYAVNSASLVSIDPIIMEQHGLKVGDLVRVATFWRDMLARIGDPDEKDRGSSLIRLNRFQRQTLKARLYERVEINLYGEHPAQRVLLLPAVDLSTAASHHVEEHLKEEMIQNRTPVAKGTILFIHFHLSEAGTLFKVLEVEGGPGVVTAETDVALELTPDNLFGGLGLDVTFEDVGGLNKEIQLVKELIQLPLQFPSIYRQVGIQPIRGVIFYGPTGTGKTLLARAMTNEVNAQFYYINGPEIIGTIYGESEGNLRKIFGEATHHAPSVIFIDEVDVIAIKRGESGSHSDTRIVTQLLSLMDGLNKVDGIVIVATTNRIDAIDSAFRRPGRFDREFYISPPNEEGRLQILKIHTRDMPLNEESQAYLLELAKNTHGFVGADIMELCRETGLNALRRHFQDFTSGRMLAQLDPEKIRIVREDFILARNKCRPSASRETLVMTPDKGFEMIGGLSQVKEQLIDLVVNPLRTISDAFSQTEIKLLSDGIVLSGPPGTGKSLLAKAVSKEAGVNLIVVSGPELFTKWLGESEESVRHVFKLARQLAPCIIFFDQIDALAPIRGQSSGSRTTERVVNQLIRELDDLEKSDQIVIMAATNRIDLVDPALLQPGRFGITITIGFPNQEDRYEILKIYMRGMNLDDSLGSKIRQEMAMQTEGLTGAELRSLTEFFRREISKFGNKFLSQPLTKVFELWSATRHTSLSPPE
ncbi:AAA family ATPase [Thermodesulfobacteriota bacterium]